MELLADETVGLAGDLQQFPQQAFSCHLMLHRALMSQPLRILRRCQQTHELLLHGLCLTAAGQHRLQRRRQCRAVSFLYPQRQLHCLRTGLLRARHGNRLYFLDPAVRVVDDIRKTNDVSLAQSISLPERDHNKTPEAQGTLQRFGNPVGKGPVQPVMCNINNYLCVAMHVLSIAGVIPPSLPQPHRAHGPPSESRQSGPARPWDI